MNNTKNIFSYAIKDLKKNKPVRGLYSDDFIDFNEESNRLGENIETKTYSSKIKSVVVKHNTPFHSSPKIITLDDSMSKLKIVKALNSTSIILPGKNEDINMSRNDKWKHDLFNEESAYNYSAFIRNMPNLMTESKLKEIYSKFGVIKAIKVLSINIRWIEDALRCIIIEGIMLLRQLRKVMVWEYSVRL
jgi:RNA recognition motif-containing protein